LPSPGRGGGRPSEVSGRVDARNRLTVARRSRCSRDAHDTPIYGKHDQEGFARAFPDARYTLNWGIESGSSVALEGVYSATHTGTLRMPDGTELAATGRPVSVPFVTLFDVEGEKISSHRGHWDVATVMTQLGLVAAAE
jgi:predicted ester cyclase